MDAFRQLQALSLVAMALLVAPAAVPGLRRHAGRIRAAALILYLAGGAAILAQWMLSRA